MEIRSPRLAEPKAVSRRLERQGVSLWSLRRQLPQKGLLAGLTDNTMETRFSCVNAASNVEFTGYCHVTFGYLVWRFDFFDLVAVRWTCYIRHASIDLPIFALSHDRSTPGQCVYSRWAMFSSVLQTGRWMKTSHGPCRVRNIMFLTARGCMRNTFPSFV